MLIFGVCVLLVLIFINFGLPNIIWATKYKRCQRKLVLNNYIGPQLKFSLFYVVLKFKLC